MPRTAALSRVLFSLCQYDYQTLHEIEASCSRRTKMASKPWNPLPSRPNSMDYPTGPLWDIQENYAFHPRRIVFEVIQTLVLTKCEWHTCSSKGRVSEMAYMLWNFTVALMLERQHRDDHALCFVHSAQRWCSVRFGDWSIYGDSNLPDLFNFYRRVNTELALQCTDADLLILEGMGRYVTHLCQKMQLTSCNRKL